MKLPQTTLCFEFGGICANGLADKAKLRKAKLWKAKKMPEEYTHLELEPVIQKLWWPITLQKASSALCDVQSAYSSCYANTFAELNKINLYLLLSSKEIFVRKHQKLLLLIFTRVLMWALVTTRAIMHCVITYSIVHQLYKCLFNTRSGCQLMFFCTQPSLFVQVMYYWLY